MSDTAADYNLFSDANRNAPIAYNETTEGKYDGETAWAYEPVPAERESSPGGSPVQVSVSMSPEFVIHGGDGQSEEDIMQVSIPFLCQPRKLRAAAYITARRMTACTLRRRGSSQCVGEQCG